MLLDHPHVQGARDVASSFVLLFLSQTGESADRIQTQTAVCKPFYVLNRSFIGSIKFRQALNDVP